MQIRGRLTRLVLAAAAALAMWVSAGCSGGGGSGIPVAPIGAPLAPKLPTVAAFSGTTTATPPASAGPASVTVPLATSGSFGGSVVVPLASVPPNFRLQLTYSTAPPPGLPALAAVSRTPLGRTRGAHVRAPLDTFSTSIVYACFTANYIVTLNGAPQYTFVLPPHFAPDGILYYLSIYQASQWVNGYGGPGAVVDSSSATTVTVAGRFPFTISADGTPECVSLHASWDTSPSPAPATPAPSPVASTSPSPVPSPSASAGASPSPGPSTAPSTLAVDPGTLTFTSSATQTFVATATGYNGSLSAVSANAGVATVAPGASAGQFTVTPTGIGSTTITVTAGANTATVTIVVTALTPGPLVVNPTSLSLTTTASPAPLTATEAHYSGTFTAVSANAAVATVAAGGSPGQFVVTPTGAGTTAITVTGGTLTAQVTVTVSAPIVLAASPPWYSNSFDTSVPVGTPGIGDGETTRLTATESGYSGTFTATLGSDCVSAGVIFPTTSNTAPQTNSGSWVLEHPYLSPYPTGPCTITVTDTNGKSATKLFLAQYR